MQLELVQQLPSSENNEVFLARMHRGIGQQVFALFKRLPVEVARVPRIRAAFDTEREILGALTHPNIVRLVQAGEYEGTPYMLLEWVDGTPLEVPLDELGERFPLPAAVHILAAVAEALEHAHRGIIHRDIKPSNILLDRSGAVKLADFGCAKDLSPGPHARTTQTGTTRGTLAYMPPERVLERLVDKRADIYSSAVVLYEMLTGTNPYLDETDYATLERIVEVPIPAPSQALRHMGVTPPSALKYMDEPVLRALSRDPDERFDTARDFGEAILAAAAAAHIAPSRASVRQLVASFAAPPPQTTLGKLIELERG